MKYFCFRRTICSLVSIHKYGKAKETPTFKLRIEGDDPRAQFNVIARNKTSFEGGSMVDISTTGATQNFHTLLFCSGCRNFISPGDNDENPVLRSCAILKAEDHLKRVCGGVCIEYTIPIGRQVASVREVSDRKGSVFAMSIYRYPHSKTIDALRVVSNKLLQHNGQA